MWERNIKRNNFNEKTQDFSIKKGKTSGLFYASNDKGDFELKEIHSVRFLYENYRTVLILLAGLIVVNIVVYNYLYIVPVFIIEMLMYHYKDKLCVKSINRLYLFYKLLLVVEIVVFVLYLDTYYSALILLSEMVSSVIVFNLYLFIRIFLLSRQVLFKEVYELEAHKGFYVWRKSC